MSSGFHCENWLWPAPGCVSVILTLAKIHILGAGVLTSALRLVHGTSMAKMRRLGLRTGKEFLISLLLSNHGLISNHTRPLENQLSPANSPLTILDQDQIVSIIPILIKHFSQ